MAPQSAKEEVDITALLQGILNGYPGNSAIFREYLQNSDDAGAKKQVFILDERNHPVELLCDPDLRGAQGPSLLAVNDGLLSKSDWKALKKIHSSSKKQDETQTGKNGLGFRASYHLTENPHVVSGDTLMILDAHHRFIGFPGGLSVSLTADGQTYRDQLVPFIAAGVNISSSFAGTAFRLPLRTANQAQRSKIKNTETSVAEIRDLLLNFGEKELGEVILFLKHITMIEIRHINATGQDRLIGRVTIEDSPFTASTTTGVYSRKTIWEKADGSIEARRWLFRHLALDKEVATKVMSARLDYDVGDALTADKLSPIIEVALPLEGEPIKGSLYTLLPLPIKTGFPLHLNAVFALTPDRQSLKNLEEVGTAKSRERRLVEWNKVIFEEWTPILWADLLDEVSSQFPSWTIWPPVDGNPYWTNLSFNVIKTVISRGLRVFPTYSESSSGHVEFVSLESSNTILAPQQSPIKPGILTALGMQIVQPPKHIFTLLTSGKVSVSAPTLSPKSLYRVLAEGYAAGSWKPYDPHSVEDLINYLVFSTSSPALGHLKGLPWFSSRKKYNISFESRGISPTYIIPASEDESGIFGNHPHMVTWSCLSDRLRSILLRSDSSRVLNVTVIRAEDIITVLASDFGSSRDSIDAAYLGRVSDLWAWLESWVPNNRKLFRSMKQNITSFYLLPTTKNQLRRISEKVLLLDDVEGSVALERLDVPVLHRTLSSRNRNFLSTEGFVETLDKAGFLPFILDTCDPALRQDIDFRAVRRVINIITTVHVIPSPTWLTSRQKEALESLPIFEVRDAHDHSSALNPVIGPRLQIRLDNSFPLPLQDPPAIYVDMQDRLTESFVKLLEPEMLQGIEQLLVIAVDNWKRQPSVLQDRFVEEFFRFGVQLPMSIRSKLDDLPFVHANGIENRVSPKNLVHPNSIITPLYQDEVGRIPTSRSATPKFLTSMQQLGFFPSSLDSRMVDERLDYLSADVSHDSYAYSKSLVLVQLLDRFWNPIFRDSVVRHRRTAWMPLQAPSTLAPPNESRDCSQSEHSNPSSYDFVFHILRLKNSLITSLGFRSALGWSERLATDVLIRQLNSTLMLTSGEDRSRRLRDMISYFCKLQDAKQLSGEDLALLRFAVADKAWIPVLRPSGETQTVSTEYALITEVKLEHPFHQVQSLKSVPFLAAMGCTERPNLSILTRELAKFGSQVTEQEIAGYLALVLEVFTQHPDSDQSVIRVPARGGSLHPLKQVYYPDTDYLLPPSLAGKKPSHQHISRTVSDRLGIQPLSSLVLDLGDDAFEDEDQIEEDLRDRIRGFLKEYDVSYAFNEFLANADDARATDVSILLDNHHHSFPSSRLISSRFKNLHNSPSLILHNNATFSEDDFKGLRKVGRGGKVGDDDTHGRHGLGALSFYYFTDVVTVISGEYVMIMDPLGLYLPPLPGRRRTCLVRQISDISSNYHDQLVPYEGLFNFSSSHGSYNGTLICLPLRSTITANSCDLLRVKSLLDSKYKDLARNAFFFTRLVKITAIVRSELKYEDTLWAFSVNRIARTPLDANFTYQWIDLDFGNGAPQRWLISTADGSAIPPIHENTATMLKLKNDHGVLVQLALRVSPDLGPRSGGWLFSTLRLPRRTSLPFHLNSRFAISSNRQAIVFDSKDSRGERDEKSSFNAWILADLIPPLYLSTLSLLIQDVVESHLLPEPKWWLINVGDDISSHVSKSFLRLLAVSEAPLFQTVAGSLVPFKGAIFPNSSKDAVKILKALRMFGSPGLVDAYDDTGIVNLTSARNIDGEYVRNILASIPLDKLQQYYQSKDLSLDDLKNLLLYLTRKTDPSALVGLPLLVLSSNLLVPVPGVQYADRSIYMSRSSAVVELFQHTSFLHSEYSNKDFQDVWSSDAINVVQLTEGSIPGLVHMELAGLDDHAIAEQWLKAFWGEYDTLPGPPSFESLQDLPLVRSATRHLSLRECREGEVVFFADSNLRKDLYPILGHIDIDVVKPTGSLLLKAYLSNRFNDPAVNVVKCLAAKNIVDFDVLPVDLRDRLISWLQESIASAAFFWQRKDPGISRDHLMRVVMWKAHAGGRETFHSATRLKILPYSFPMSKLLPYLSAQHAISSYSSAIIAVVKFCRSISDRDQGSICMSPSDIMDAIDIPPIIVEIPRFIEYETFLRAMFNHFDIGKLRSISHRLKVFDREGKARLLSELYDDTVELFSSCLQYTSTSSFVREELVQDASRGTLRLLGLNHTICVDSFRVCAEAVQQAFFMHLEGRGPSLHDLREMASIAFHCYEHTLPPEIMRRESIWASLDDLKFIRPKDIRRQGASYPASAYGESHLSLLVSPNECVLSKFEPIAWTQRTLFFEEPSEDIIAVNQKLGIPHAAEVVRHLQVLATQIAPQYPGNLTLLSDLKATYKWLNDNAEEARQHLVRLAEKKIFLNVNDPRHDHWVGEWASAQEMVLDLDYEHGDMKRVKSFLQGYGSLLRATGCATMTLLTRTRLDEIAPETTSRRQEIMSNLNEMRRMAELTDMFFVPTEEWDVYTPGIDAMDEEELEVRAELRDLSEDEMDESTMAVEDIQDQGKQDMHGHRVVLAAVVPYFRDAQFWSHPNGRVRFFGTAFAAKAVLDFIYTGAFDDEPISANPVRMTGHLRELLDLLRVADMFDMQDLKTMVQISIIRKHEQRLIPHHAEILRIANLYKATTLIEALDEVARDNGVLLQRFGQKAGAKT